MRVFTADHFDEPHGQKEWRRSVDGLARIEKVQSHPSMIEFQNKCYFEAVYMLVQSQSMLEAAFNPRAHALTPVLQIYRVQNKKVLRDVR